MKPTILIHWNLWKNDQEFPTKKGKYQYSSGKPLQMMSNLPVTSDHLSDVTALYKSVASGRFHCTRISTCHLYLFTTSSGVSPVHMDHIPVGPSVQVVLHNRNIE